MPFTEEDKRVIAWMNRMQGLRVLYVDDDPNSKQCCPTCSRPLPVPRAKRSRPGVVTKVYDVLMRADLALDDGEKIICTTPSFVDTKHGIAGVHSYHFFPASGAWPETKTS